MKKLIKSNKQLMATLFPDGEEGRIGAADVIFRGYDVIEEYHAAILL